MQRDASPKVRVSSIARCFKPNAQALEGDASVRSPGRPAGC